MVVSYCIEYFELEFKSPERTDFVTWKIHRSSEPSQLRVRSAFWSAKGSAHPPFHVQQVDCKSTAAWGRSYRSIITGLCNVGDAVKSSKLKFRVRIDRHDQLTDWLIDTMFAQSLQLFILALWQNLIQVEVIEVLARHPKLGFEFSMNNHGIWWLLPQVVLIERRELETIYNQAEWRSGSA